MVEYLTRGMRMETLALQSPRGMFERELHRPFRFNDNEKLYWQNVAAGPVTDAQWEDAVAGSQVREVVHSVGHRYLAYARRVIVSEKGDIPESRMRLIHASSVLRNIVWEDGPHLAGAVECAGKLMHPDKPLLVREAGAGILKNAAWYEGKHIPPTLDLALCNWPRASVRMRDETLRALQYMARHSKGLLENEDVRNFLHERMKDENAVIAENANVVFGDVFAS